MPTDLNSRYAPEDRWKAVVEHEAGLLVVNAGPGTGKTFSLLRKIEGLLQRHVSPGNIYYLTFVNSIVDAFKADVAEPSPKGLSKTAEELGIKVSTLHSLAFKVVKTYREKLALPKQIEPLDPRPSSESLTTSVALGELLTIVRLVCSRTKDLFDTDVERIMHIWQNDSSVPSDLAYLRDSFRQLRQLYDLMPWDGFVLLANRAIKQHGLPSWLQQATHFLVDEYQDFNPVEQQFIDLITEPSDSVVIVGDTDQSIYSGRSASPKGLRALLRRDRVSTVNFVLCRRCPRKLIVGANKVLAMIDPQGFQARALQPHKAEEGTLVIRDDLKSCKAELDLLADCIRTWIRRSVRCVLLLFPSRKALDFYRAQLERRGIQFAAERGQGEELLHAMLKLVLLGSQPFLERLLVHTHSALERRFGADVLPLMVQESLSLEAALARASTVKRWRKDVRAAHATFIEELQTIRSRDAAAIAALCAMKGLSCSSDTITRLLSAPETLSILERVQLATRTITPAPQESGTRVRGLTMHGSKGLSEPVVLMPAMEDKWLPGLATGDSLNEKHRLFYVALTRSEQDVMITCPNSRAPKDPLNFRIAGSRSGLSRYAKRLRRP